MCRARAGEQSFVASVKGVYVGSQEWVPEVPGVLLREVERGRSMIFGAAGMGAGPG